MPAGTPPVHNPFFTAEVNAAAMAAVAFAVTLPEPATDFLESWLVGDVGAIQRRWPGCPATATPAATSLRQVRLAIHAVAMECLLAPGMPAALLLQQQVTKWAIAHGLSDVDGLRRRLAVDHGVLVNWLHRSRADLQAALHPSNAVDRCHTVPANHVHTVSFPSEEPCHEQTCN